MSNYILDGHTAVEEPDLMKWAKWFETGNRVVDKSVADVSLGGDKVGQVTVSTVFLGINHSFSDSDRPLLFETMVFGGKLDQEMDRCSTWEAAEKMHELMCEKVKLSVKE